MKHKGHAKRIFLYFLLSLFLIIILGASIYLGKLYTEYNAKKHVETTVTTTTEEPTTVEETTKEATDSPAVLQGKEIFDVGLLSETKKYETLIPFYAHCTSADIGEGSYMVTNCKLGLFSLGGTIGAGAAYDDILYASYNNATYLLLCRNTDEGYVCVMSNPTGSEMSSPFIFSTKDIEFSCVGVDKFLIRANESSTQQLYLLNTAGDIVFSPLSSVYCSDYSDGFILCRSGSSYYYVNSYGLTVSPNYYYATDFNHGKAVVKDNSGYKIIDKNFKTIYESKNKLVSYVSLFAEYSENEKELTFRDYEHNEFGTYKTSQVIDVLEYNNPIMIYKEFPTSKETFIKITTQAELFCTDTSTKCDAALGDGECFFYTEKSDDTDSAFLCDSFGTFSIAIYDFGSLASQTDEYYIINSKSKKNKIYLIDKKSAENIAAFEKTTLVSACDEYILLENDNTTYSLYDTDNKEFVYENKNKIFLFKTNGHMFFSYIKGKKLVLESEKQAKLLQFEVS